MAITPGSWAASNFLKVGDKLVELNGEPIVTWGALSTFEKLAMPLVLGFTRAAAALPREATARGEASDYKLGAWRLLFDHIHDKPLPKVGV